METLLRDWPNPHLRDRTHNLHSFHHGWGPGAVRVLESVCASLCLCVYAHARETGSRLFNEKEKQYHRKEPISILSVHMLTPCCP